MLHDSDLLKAHQPNTNGGLNGMSSFCFFVVGSGFHPNVLRLEGSMHHKQRESDLGEIWSVASCRVALLVELLSGDETCSLKSK